MKRVILLLMMMGMLLVGVVSAESSDACSLELSLINQDPYPAAPGSYVKLVFQVSGVDNSNCDGAEVQFVPTYPFTLDDNEDAVKILNSGTYVSNYNNDWMLTYKVRVDKDAIEGENDVTIVYGSGSSGSEPSIKNTFTVEIEDTRTNFDAVIQDVSDSEVSIAIANVGKYDANSVIVRIPEQDDFKTIKTSGQMVGNLESGDYTLASFELTSNMGQRTSGEKQNERMSVEPEDTTLIFEIHYTDSIGERRVVNMELPLFTNYFYSADEASSQIVPGTRGFGMQGKNESSTPWWNYGLIVLVLLLVVFFVNRKYPKLFNRLRKSKKNPKSNSVPEWTKK